MSRQLVCRVGLAVGVLVSLWSGPALADEIRLKDGAAFSATVLGKDRDSVAVKLARSDIASIDGASLPPPVTVGTAAPAFTAVDLNGITQSLPDPRGSVTLLQFWATWCPHCRSDLSLMKNLFARYRDRGLRIVTVSVDQDRGALRGFVRSHDVPYPVIAAADRPASRQPSVPDLYEMQGVPAYYLIDAQGTIAQTFSGSVTEMRRDLESELSRLLATVKPRR